MLMVARMWRHPRGCARAAAASRRPTPRTRPSLSRVFVDWSQERKSSSIFRKIIVEKKSETTFVTRSRSIDRRARFDPSHGTHRTRFRRIVRTLTAATATATDRRQIKRAASHPPVHRHQRSTACHITTESEARDVAAAQEPERAGQLGAARIPRRQHDEQTDRADAAEEDAGEEGRAGIQVGGRPRPWEPIITFIFSRFSELNPSRSTTDADRASHLNSTRHNSPTDAMISPASKFVCKSKLRAGYV